MTYKNMTELLEEKRLGNYSLRKYIIGYDDFRAAISGIPCGEYISLIGPDNSGHRLNTLLMSNTPMEKRTNLEFLMKANGDVLIGGLGLGLIVLPLQEKENVKSITIIEKSQEVIDLVASQLPLTDKVKIICADVYNYIPDIKYDTIYLDIWPEINSDIYYEEMMPLKKKFRKYLVSKDKNPNRFIKCWAEKHARYNWRLV